MSEVTCEGCGRVVAPSQETAYQMFTVWHRIHPKSTSNVMKRAEQRFLCRPCLDTMDRSGVSWNQPQLWETP